MFIQRKEFRILSVFMLLLALSMLSLSVDGTVAGQTNRIPPYTFQGQGPPYFFEGVASPINVLDSLNTVKSNVNYFASLGSRVTGYPGSYQAAKYIRSRFVEYGLQNVSLYEANITVPIDHGAELKVLAPISKRVTLYPLWPNVAAIVKTPPGGISGNLVYAGDGSSFDGVAVDGNIVLMDFNSLQNWLNAAKLGAKAVIFIEPFDTTWQQAKMKIIDIAFSFPRLYIKRADAQTLLGLISQGPVAVNLESDMRFETVQAPNVLGWARGTHLPDLYVILSAHFDSFSYVPSVAPGADGSIGVSALLELAKYYGAHPAKYTILFMAYSGTYQGLMGARNFVWDQIVNDPDHIFRDASGNEKIVIQLHLDMSGEKPYSGISNTGMFYCMNQGLAKGRETFVKYYIVGETGGGLLRAIESTISPDFKVDTYMFGSSVSFSASSVPILPVIFDSEALVIIGGTAISIFTPQASRNSWGTPMDTPERINFANLENQLKFAYPFVDTIVNDVRLRTEFIPAWVPTFGQVYGPEWINVAGMVGEYNDATGWYQPVPGAMVLHRGDPWAGTGWAPIAGIWTYSFADQNGRFEIFGGAMGYQLATWVFQSYVLDPETGEVIYTPDRGDRAYGVAAGGTSGQAGWFALYKHPFDIGLITVFKSAHIVLFDLGDPYLHNQALDNSVAISYDDIRSHYPPIHRAIEGTIYSGTGTSVAVMHIPMDIPVEIVMGASYALRLPLGILNNASAEQPYGAGYQMSKPGQVYVLKNTALDFAESFYWLNDARLRLLGGLAIDVSKANAIHEETRLRIAEAKKAFNLYEYSQSEYLAASAWRYERDVYLALKNDIEDSINTVPFFGVLLIPFALIAERALTAFRGRKRLLSILVCYMVPSIILWLLHPGFILSQDSAIVLSGFTILILSMPLIGIIGGLFLEALKSLRQRIMGFHFAEMSRSDAALLAFVHGIEQMKKRRLRTSMMIFSIIVVTTGVTLFMSASSLTATRQIVGTTQMPYDGIFIRPLQWGRVMPTPRSVIGNNLGDVVVRLMDTDLGSNATIAPRSWLYMYSPFTPIKVQKDSKATQVSSILGLSHKEAEVTGLDKLLVAGRWFIESDFRAVILTTTEAGRLGVTAVPDYVNFVGMNMTVVGIIDQAGINAFRDLDGEAITPLEYRIDNVAYDVHMDANDVMVVPYQFSKSIGAWTVSAAVKMNNSSQLKSAGSLFFELFQLQTIVGLDGKQFIFDKAMFIVLFGWQYQLIPLGIAVLLMANLAFSAVQERKGEISVLGSLGLSPLHVAALFLAESATFAILGGLAGYLVGLFISMSVKNQIGVSINFASMWVVTAVGIVMLAVFLSAIYPSLLSSRLVTPSLMRTWKPAKPVGDTWVTPLPFIADDESEANRVLAYLSEFFSSHDSYEAEVFWTRKIQFTEKEEAGKVEKVVLMDTSLPPYETGINQTVVFLATKPANMTRFNFQVVLDRTSGTRQHWEARNISYLDNIRKQLLLWRSLKPEERDEYVYKYRMLASRK